MPLLPGAAIQPNLELKTQPKPVLGSLPLAFALPGNPNVKRSVNLVTFGENKNPTMWGKFFMIAISFCHETQLLWNVSFTTKDQACNSFNILTF